MIFIFLPSQNKKNCLNRVLKIESKLLNFYETLNSIRGQIDSCFQQVKGALNEVQEIKSEFNYQNDNNEESSLTTTTTTTTVSPSNTIQLSNNTNQSSITTALD